MDFFQKLWEAFLRALDQNQLVMLLGKTLLALAVFLVFVVLGRVARNSVKRITSRTSRNANLPILLSNLSYVGMLIIAILTVLSIYTGAGLSTLVTLFGLVSLAISLSVQDVLRNFVAGVFLLLEQPFSIGDRIKVRDYEGRIENIEIRTTTVHTDEGVLVVIPNSIVFAEIVTNRTAFSQRLTNIYFLITVTPETPFESTCEKIKEIVTGFEPAMVSADPAPQVFVEQTGGKKTLARVDFWSPISAPGNTNSELVQALAEGLPEVEISTTKLAVPA
ncbi:MAG TPA: mechanosensitive ion channel family protein [Chloroflexia bacterium]|nr:mechanosensitive ion channel family protein [Chloroflexia bacterium]